MSGHAPKGISRCLLEPLGTLASSKSWTGRRRPAPPHTSGVWALDLGAPHPCSASLCQTVPSDPSWWVLSDAPAASAAPPRPEPAVVEKARRMWADGFMPGQWAVSRCLRADTSLLLLTRLFPSSLVVDRLCIFIPLFALLLVFIPFFLFSEVVASTGLQFSPLHWLQTLFFTAILCLDTSVCYSPPRSVDRQVHNLFLFISNSVFII